MKKVVLLRHGESTWNRENRFTGWTDVDLSPMGVEEAQSLEIDDAGQFPFWNGVYIVSETCNQNTKCCFGRYGFVANSC